MKNIQSLQEWEKLISSKAIVVGYFSHDKCNVCTVLLPKVEQLVLQDFPKVELAYCNIEHAPELAAQQSVFTAPAIVIFVEGKESVRYSRNIGLTPLAQSITRPYQMLFEE